MYRPTTRTSEKCIACFPRLEGKDETISPDGAPTESRCMSACVGKIRMQGLVKIDEEGGWVKDPKNPLYYLVRERQVALPLYAQFGTEPNGYYIPPRWVPRNYLQQMFGPGVEVEPAINMARQSLYRFAAISLLDPRYGRVSGGLWPAIFSGWLVGTAMA
jgi:nitrate reductase beta subunit